MRKNLFPKSFFGVIFLSLVFFISCKEAAREVTAENPVQAEYLIDRWKTSSAFYILLPNKKLVKKGFDSDIEVHGTWELDANILFFKFDDDTKERYDIKATLKNRFLSTYPGNYVDLPMEFIRAKIQPDN